MPQGPNYTDNFCVVFTLNGYASFLGFLADFLYHNQHFKSFESV
jgi:hypothetical protein